MAISFPFDKSPSFIFGEIRRPIAQVLFYAPKIRKWREVWMIVDTGADYTILPYYLAKLLDVRITKDCKKYITSGIGGTESVYIHFGMRVRLGNWERRIPVGFLKRDDIPPLLGRHLFLETFDTRLSKKHRITFQD